jgi:hypothetical protein
MREGLEGVSGRMKNFSLYFNLELTWVKLLLKRTKIITTTKYNLDRRLTICFSA